MDIEVGRKHRVTITIDDEDYDRYKQIKWYSYLSTDGKIKIASKIKFLNQNHRFIQLSRFIKRAEYETKFIIHKNGNNLDFRKSNLEFLDSSDLQKSAHKKHGLSKFNGVSFHAPSDKWLARININGKQKHLGLFSKDIDAAKAYNEAAIETGNSNYRLNEL